MHARLLAIGLSLLCAAAINLGTPKPGAHAHTLMEVHHQPSYRVVKEVNYSGLPPPFTTLEEVASENNGMLMIIPVDGLTKLGFLELPTALNSIAGMALPDQSGDLASFDYTLSSLKVAAFKFGHTPVTISGGKVQFVLEDIEMKVTLNWHAVESVWPHPAGTGTADVIALATASALISISVVNQIPQITTSNADMVISGLNVHVAGSTLSPIINVVTSLIQGSIKTMVEEQVEAAIAKNVDRSVNALLVGLTYRYPIKPGITLNYHLTSTPWIISLGVVVRIVGGFETSTGACPSPHHSLGLIASSTDINVIGDEYMVNSGAWAAYNTGILTTTLSYRDMPSTPGIPNPLNTSFWASIAPGLTSKYPNAGMEVVCNATASPVFNIQPTTSTLAGPVKLEFSVVTGTATPNVFALQCDAFAAVNFTVAVQADGTNTLIITALPSKTPLLSNCKLIDSKVGTVSTLMLNVIMKIIANKLVMILNDNLEDGFPLPSPPDPITIENTALYAGTNMFQFSSNIEGPWGGVGPSSSPDPDREYRIMTTEELIV